jgi:hypothetical protein
LIRLGKTNPSYSSIKRCSAHSVCQAESSATVTPKANTSECEFGNHLACFWSILCASCQEFDEMSELASFSESRAKARFSASSFCALTLRTPGRLLRLLAKPRSLIETLHYWLERYRTFWAGRASRKQRIDRCRRCKLSAALQEQSKAWLNAGRLGSK